MSTSPSIFQPLVSVVIVNWNTKDHLLECIGSLGGDRVEAGLEIIVVDNNSSDGSADAVQLYYPAVTLIRNEQNLMFAGGVNTGIANSRGKYLLFLNPDVLITPKVIYELSEYLEKHRDVAAISPSLYYPDGKFQSEFFLHLPSLCQLVLFYTPVNRFARKSKSLRLRYYEMTYDPEGEMEMPQLPGGCMMVSRSAINVAGVMDEDFTLYYEDVDWCTRLSQCGRLILFVNASVFHHGGGSHEKLSSWVYGRFRVSMLLYFRKNRGRFEFFVARSIFFALVYIPFLVRSIQKLFPSNDRNLNNYHLEKYKLFLDEYRNRKPSFDKY
jgi:GT2 family glycosyltransferase